MARSSLQGAGGGVAPLMEESARRQLRRLKSSLEAARAAGDPKEVHALRVASRRLNEPLRLMQESAGRGRVRRCRRALRRLRRAYRHVRDLDVLAETFREHESSGLISPEHRAGLTPILDAWRADAFERAQSVAASQRWAADFKRIRRICKRFARRNGDTAARLEAGLDEQLRERVAALKSGGVGAGADLHPARIAVKKLRYCAELRQRLGVADHSALIAVLTDAQALLGHWNDQLTAAAWLTALASNREMMSSLTSLCADMLELAGRVMRVAEADRDRIETFWPRVLAALEVPTNGASSRLRLAPDSAEAAVALSTTAATAAHVAPRSTAAGGRPQDN